MLMRSLVNRCHSAIFKPGWIKNCEHAIRQVDDAIGTQVLCRAADIVASESGGVCYIRVTQRNLIATRTDRGPTGRKALVVAALSDDFILIGAQENLSDSILPSRRARRRPDDQGAAKVRAAQAAIAAWPCQLRFKFHGSPKAFLIINARTNVSLLARFLFETKLGAK